MSENLICKIPSLRQKVIFKKKLHDIKMKAQKKFSCKKFRAK